MSNTSSDAHDVADKGKDDNAESSSSTSNPGSNSTFNFLPKAKLSALSYFKSFTPSGFKWNDNRLPSFPPSSWDLSRSPNSGTGASDWDYNVEKWRIELEKWKDKIRSPIPQSPGGKQSESKEEGQEDSREAGQGESSNQPEDREVINADDTPDSRTLAMRIKALIDEKFSLSSKPSIRRSSSSAPTTPQHDSGEGTSNPSKGFGSMFTGIDSKLAAMLSSETIMNGEVGKGIEKGRESVWAMLDKLRYSGRSTNVDKGKGKATETETSVEEGHDTGYEETDSIMMCTPLQPTTDLEPEIAESELEYVDDQEYEREPADVGTQQSGPSASAEASSDASKKPNEQPPDETAATEKSKTSPKAKRTFYPSSTKLSLEVTWWGYRLFLPPPIMAQLSNARVAAAKRGAMVTAALKWVIDQVPILMVPPQMRPGLMMIKRLSPYLGYVGAFVAWSWGRIQAKDTGNGVVLTATWLLPIAILPASWDFEVHGRPKETPAPSSAPDPTGITSGINSSSVAGGSTSNAEPTVRSTGTSGEGMSNSKLSTRKASSSRIERRESAK